MANLVQPAGAALRQGAIDSPRLAPPSAPRAQNLGPNYGSAPCQTRYILRQRVKDWAIYCAASAALPASAGCGIQAPGKSPPASAQNADSGGGSCSRPPRRGAWAINSSRMEPADGFARMQVQHRTGRAFGDQAVALRFVLESSAFRLAARGLCTKAGWAMKDMPRSISSRIWR